MIKHAKVIILVLIALVYCPSQTVFQEFGPPPPSSPPPSVIVEANPSECQEVSRGAGRVIIVEATAYTHTGNRTYTGVWPIAGRTIAADPSVIPLGSKVFIEGIGYRTVEDTGGAIKGNKVDVFMDTERECNKWGVQKVKLEVIEN